MCLCRFWGVVVRPSHLHLVRHRGLCDARPQLHHHLSAKSAVRKSVNCSGIGGSLLAVLLSIEFFSSLSDYQLLNPSSTNPGLRNKRNLPAFCVVPPIDFQPILGDIPHHTRLYAHHRDEPPRSQRHSLHRASLLSALKFQTIAHHEYPMYVPQATAPYKSPPADIRTSHVLAPNPWHA